MSDPWSRLVVATAWRLRRLRKFSHRLQLMFLESRSLKAFSAGSGLVCESPVRVSGGTGELVIGDDVHLGHAGAIRIGNGAVLLQPRTPESLVRIGSKTHFSNNVSIIACDQVMIGEGCLIGDMVSITDADGHGLAASERGQSRGKIAPVRIGANVWLGSRVAVLKGVEIGENSVVGAMSVVTHSIPANSIAAGIPARVLRSL